MLNFRHDYDFLCFNLKKSEWNSRLWRALVESANLVNDSTFGKLESPTCSISKMSLQHTSLAGHQLNQLAYSHPRREAMRVHDLSEKYRIQSFWRFSEDFPNVVRSSYERFRTFSEHFRRLPRKIRRCFDSTYFGSFCIETRQIRRDVIDIFTYERYIRYDFSQWEKSL